MLNRRSFQSLTLLGASALVSLGALSNPVSAQAQRGGRGASGSNAPIGMALNVMGGSGRLTSTVDPTRSSVMSLLMRDDVRNEILLDLKQRNAIDALKKSSEADLTTKIQSNIQTTIQTTIQNLNQGNQGAPGGSGAAANVGQNLRNMSPEDRQAMIEQLRTATEATLTSTQKEIDQKIEALLRPAQIKRLHELDLQWRGPLALADPQVAAPVNLTPDQKKKVDGLLQEFRTAQTEAMSSVANGITTRFGAASNTGAAGGGNSANSAGNGNANRRPNPAAIREEMNTKMDQAQKDVDKVRKTLGAKVLPLLTAEQQQTWKTLVGKPFLFRDLTE